MSVNTAAMGRPQLIGDIASRFGAQVLVLSVDARRIVGATGKASSGFEVTTHGGSRGTGVDALEWVQRAQELGAGEILLNSMDADGSRSGFDLELIAAVRATTTLPIVASGGAGELKDFPAAVSAGADAVLAASVFHFGTLTVSAVKDELARAGFEVR